MRISRLPIAVTFLVSLYAPGFSAWAAPSYQSILKKWTRHDAVYVWTNLEARLIWNATYLSDEFRAARLKKMARLYEWSAGEEGRHFSEDRAEAGQFDLFFLAVYAGSSQWPEVGKDEGKWRIVLEAQGRGEAVEPVLFERVPVTEVERALYPHLDKWSQGYLVRFPKVIERGEPFRLRMTGIPARSELVWKNR